MGRDVLMKIEEKGFIIYGIVTDDPSFFPGRQIIMRNIDIL